MQYLISVLAEGDPTGTDKEQADIDVFNERLQANGQWVFAGGLGEPSPAKVIDNRAGKGLVTDGPFIEAKEYMVGFWIVDVADADTALALARLGSEACNRRVELRPFLVP